MSRRTYNCNEVLLDHSRMVELRSSGNMNLGINDDFAARLALEKGMGPTKTTANIAFHFFSWVAVGGGIYSIYLSFTDRWWWFIVGISFVSIVWKANKSGNSENYLDAALGDEEFYERVRSMNGWLYQFEEESVTVVLREDERTM